MRRGLYAIYDTIAEEYIGAPIYTFPAAPAAIRFFTDILADKQTSVGNHPQDYELHQLGFLQSVDPVIAEHREVILTGKAWLATQPQPTAAAPQLQLKREA